MAQVGIGGQVILSRVDPPIFSEKVNLLGKWCHQQNSWMQSSTTSVIACVTHKAAGLLNMPRCSEISPAANFPWKPSDERSCCDNRKGFEGNGGQIESKSPVYVCNWCIRSEMLVSRRILLRMRPGKQSRKMQKATTATTTTTTKQTFLQDRIWGVG